ncbi:ead/Ea22-like family protein [Enterobacter sp. Tr-810]|uniref:ead/Ea22-like family protein n=1 Tax=Enterobacter sp. Tr-810 TaxID=2608347 RepID=UPI00141A5A02|nr:ead/Ea22-like family protein [Enterobacter sp. Tr-810]NIF35276.1 ead/Ea22-like family protein [Enterobacter sp. Tr-810]
MAIINTHGRQPNEHFDKQALREAAEKATQGEWWSDVVETDGEYGEGEDRVSGYHSYAFYVGHESLLDMTNSTAACIHTEWDHDYHMAWDETAKRNAEFIAAANPDTVLALLVELEAAEKQIAGQREIMRQAASDIAYAIFNLTGSDLSRLKPGVVETTDPTDTALIAERNLRAAAGKGE